MKTPPVQYTIEKTADGFLGQCVQFPQIFTESKTQAGLKKEMDIVLDGYFKICPQASRDIKRNVGHGTYEIKAKA